MGIDEKVIFVNATPHTAHSVPTLTFNLEDGEATASQSSVEVITQVRAAQTQHCSTMFLSLFRGYANFCCCCCLPPSQVPDKKIGTILLLCLQ